MTDWIKLDDKEPDIGKKYLVAGNVATYHGCSVARYAGEGVFFMHGCRRVPNPTHWMELPELPKE